MKDTVMEPSDEKLLDAERAEPGLQVRLMNEAQAAYLAGRHRVTYYLDVDKAWANLRNAVARNRATSQTSNPNSPADLKARADSLRITQRALEYFKSLGKDAEKPAPAVPTALAVQRIFGIHDSPLEAAFANMPAPEAQPAQSAPMTFDPPPTMASKRQHATRRSI